MGWGEIGRASEVCPVAILHVFLPDVQMKSIQVSWSRWSPPHLPPANLGARHWAGTDARRPEGGERIDAGCERRRLGQLARPAGGRGSPPDRGGRKAVPVEQAALLLDGGAVGRSTPASVGTEQRAGQAPLVDVVASRVTLGFVSLIIWDHHPGLLRWQGAEGVWRQGGSTE